MSTENNGTESGRINVKDSAGKSYARAVTQDDITVMSDITTQEHQDSSQHISMNTPNMQQKENGEVDDNVTVMSDVTMVYNSSNVDDSNVEKDKSDDNAEKRHTHHDKEKEKDPKSDEIRNNENINTDNTKVNCDKQQVTYSDKVNNDDTNNISSKNIQKDKDEVQDKEGTKQVQNPYTKKRDQNTNNEKEEMKKSKTHPTYAQATKNTVNQPNAPPKHDSKNLGDESKSIRVRFSFTGENDNEPKNRVKKRILYEVMQCAKAIDNSASLMTWNNNDNSWNLNGDEAMLIDEGTISKYIDMPETNKSINRGEMYYSNGVRIQTSMSAGVFTESWNNKKYKQEDNSPFKKWKPIRIAEIQKHETAHAIGYLAGSTERGHYDTLIESLEKEFEYDIELSYQTVFQPGISKKVWNYAQEMARYQFKNEYSRDFKMLKFSMAPSALVIFTHDESKTKEIRKKFIEKYGSLVDGVWPAMADHSRLRFIPIVKGYLNDDEVKEQLYEHLKHQATSKAGEVRLEFKFKNITEKMPYFQNQSLEQIVHSITTKENNDIPIFKHISRKWSQNVNKRELEVTIATALVDEATTTLRGLRNFLIKEFGQEARNHFIEVQKGKTWKITPMKRNFTKYNDDLDDNLGTFIKNSNNQDQLSKVLIEGMELVIDQGKEINATNDKLKADRDEHNGKINKTIPDTKENEGAQDTDSNNNGSDSNTSNVIEISDEEQESKSESPGEPSSNDQNNYLTDKVWDDIRLDGEYKVKPASDNEIRKVLNTLDKHEINVCDIDNWMNAHWDKIEVMIQEANSKEYSVMKRIVKQIIESRIDNNNENNTKTTTDEMETTKTTLGIDDQSKANGTTTIDDNRQQIQEKENSNPNQVRTDHPHQEESPPSKGEMTGEGQKV